MVKQAVYRRGDMLRLEAWEEPMSSDPDSRDMLAVKEGDRRAFERLFSKYATPLHRFVFRFVGNGAVAEELVQEIFFKIYRAAPKYEPKSRFSTYLYRVATNHCLNEVRKASYKERFDSLDQESEGNQTGMDLPDIDQPSADQALTGQRLARVLQRALMELPENQRAALLLHRLDALSYQEIAETLDLSIGAVKSLIHRAKTTLQRHLEVWNEEGS